MSAGTSDDTAVQAAFAAVPRRGFLPDHQQRFADLDRPLPLGLGQTSSQPTTVRQMLALADVRTGQRVLDVGAGSGWTTSLLAHLVGPTGEVVGVELEPDLARWGAENVGRTAMPWASVRPAVPGVLGVPDLAPYDRVLVSADADRLPDELVRQLGPEGVMVVPVRSRMLVVRPGPGGRVDVARHGRYSFVPLRRER